MKALREDRRSLAVQVRDRIWHEVEAGVLHAGEKLPSEQDLAARFGVSRATVREALKIMEEERVVLCRHGVGRFLAPDPASVLTDEMTRLKSVTELTRGLGISPTTKVISLREEPADDLVSSRLDLEPSSPVVVVERVRQAKGEPVIYTVDYFARHVVPGPLRAEEFEGSLFAQMEEKWGLQLVYAKTVISAILLDSETCQRIGVPEGIPWLMMEEIVLDAQDRPQLYSNDYHRGDKMQFRVLRHRR